MSCAHEHDPFENRWVVTGRDPEHLLLAHDDVQKTVGRPPQGVWQELFDHLEPGDGLPDVIVTVVEALAPRHPAEAHN